MQTLAVLGVLAIGGLVAAVAGLWVFMSATARPLHPDAHEVPSVSGAAPSPKWADAIERGRQIARAEITEQNLPGLSVAVGIGGEMVWTEGFGWADLEERLPVAPETLFRIGEASKALTSAAVGLLLEKNTLRLDDEIQTYVPEFPKKVWPVTLRHLMAHTGGIGDDAGDEAPLANAVGSDGRVNRRCERTVDGFQMDDFAARDLLFEPGTQYRPSSYSWLVVSAAVEAAARAQTFFAFMRTQIFEPLGMTSTRPDVASEQIPDRATFYFPRFAGDPRYGPESVRPGDHSCYAGGGAFLSTPSDLVRFGMAIDAGTLLQPDTVQLLQTEQQLKTGEKTGYGLGWRLETHPLAGHPARMAGHGTKEDFIGGTAYLMTFPERRIVVAVTTNISFADAQSVALQIAEAFAGPEKSPAAK